MTVSIDLRGKAFRKALLPMAVAFAMAGSVHAAGSDGWVGVRTQAAMTRTSEPAPAATAAAAAAHATWTLSMHGAPTVDAATVSPLEASKPVHVEVSLNLHNVDELEAFLHAVNDPASQQYHHFLTPAQFKARYSPTDAEVAQVTAHLRQSGFTNVQVSGNNLLVSADGNANTVSAAFRTTMRTFAFGGKQRIANDSAVQVPQALGGIIDSVLGLQNLNVPHTMHHIVGPAPGGGANHANVLAAASQVSHSPSDFPAIYDAGSTPTASNTTVGIVTWGDMTQTITDLKSFTTKAGMSTVTTQVVKTGSNSYADDPDGDGEWNLDSQTIVGTSGGVGTLVFYSAPNCSNDSCLTDAAITAAYNRAVTDNVAKVINVSLGEDESAANSSGTQAADDRIFAQAVAQGQTFSIASGDAGVYQWSSDPVEGAPGYVTNSAGTVEISLSHYSVSEPASSPNVVAVGGTTLSTTGTTWSGETVWNEGLAAVDSSNGDNNKRLWATGGGVSLYEAAPAWQTTALGSSVTKRQVPDVAFDAASATGANIIIQGQTYQIGGTSLASPIFVGIWARILSANSNTLGLPTQNMYAHFPSDASPLHDVTSGNNGYNGYGYAAKAGYDNSTGWGSLDIAKFNSYVTQYWGGGGGTGGTPTANFSFVTSGLTATFTDSSTDSGGSISSHSWTFGDGGTSTATSPSHTYAAAGTYSVSETVTDGTSGKTSSKTSSVTVSSTGSPSQLLVNPGFETGTASPWTMSASVLCSNSSCSGETAHGGSWFAWMDGYGRTHTDTVSQKVTIPSGKSSATLSFYLHIDTAETSKTSAYDKLTVQVLNSSGTVLKTLATYSNLNAASGYAQRSFDLSAYIGQTVTIKFTGTEDSSLQTSFVLDDAALNVQ